MRLLIDTNIGSFAIKGQRGVDRRLAAIDKSNLTVSSIVLAEAWFGSQHSSEPQRWLSAWTQLVAEWEVLAFDAACAQRYAVIRHDLERRGKPIGDRDTMIAATALVHGLTVITDNVKEFRRVRGLRADNWVQRV